MRLLNRFKIDRINAIVALGVWLTVLVVYTLTKAPTLSFWDCGEFIAAAAILGVPHPPGSPLYMLLGRLFTVIPFSSDIAVRVNMLSVIPSSLTALFGYLAAVRILRECLGDQVSALTRGLTYAGGAAGAFFLAFGLTNWNNSVEAEVYGLSMMMLIAIFWLAMIYLKHAGSAFGERIMLLIFFMAFAGIGVHMTTFLVAPVAALLFILKRDTPPRIWLTVGAFLIFELYLMFAMSSRPGEIPYYVPIIIVLIVYMFYVFSFDRVPSIYLFAGAGFLLSIIPVAGHIVQAVRGYAGDESLSSGLSALAIVGGVSFSGLLALALFLLYRYVKTKPSEKRSFHDLVIASFVLVSGVMTAIVLLNLRGYGLFLLITAFVGLAFVLALIRHIRWPMLVATVCASMVVLGVKEMFWGILIGAVVIAVMGLVFRQADWRNALLVLLVAVLGYSVHLVIPIRSAQQPVINENNPSQNLTATINFIERRQYGTQSMVERMFARRAEWANQFGTYRRMGFWGFFSEQYGLTHARFVVLFIVGLYGIWEIVRKRAQLGVPFLILLLFASVGLILYMNFADGTRQSAVTGLDYIEVRDRDYFFTPAFIMFGMAIGIGIATIVQFVRESVGKRTYRAGNVIIGAVCILFLLPWVALSNNYFLSDRSGDYTPFDYGWNMLASCSQDAILITAADNDTFPLWCLQEAYGIRKDVDVVNLSLANAKWYIKQLQSALGINLGWTDEDIDSLQVFRDQYGNVHRLQDQVVTGVISQNFGKRPIHFAMTAPSSSHQFFGRSVDSMLAMQGLVWRLERTGGDRVVDVETSTDLLTNPDKFKFRSIADTTVYKNETTQRLTKNYIPSFLLVADSLRSRGDLARASSLMEKAVEFVPYSEDGIEFLAALYADLGDRDKLDRLISANRYADVRWLKTVRARLEKRHGTPETAEQAYLKVLSEYPDYRPALDDLVRLYFANQQPERMKSVLTTWLKFNPSDEEIKRLLAGVEEELKRLDSTNSSNL